jgi:hypothetical protein
MKKALIDKRFMTVVQRINADEAEFETTNDFFWKPCPDNVEDAWFYDPETESFIDPHVASRDEFGNPVEPFVMQRMRAYPSTGDQLDMIYKEIKATGTISPNGEWYKSVEFVKNNVPKPGTAGDPGYTPTISNPYAPNDGILPQSKINN